MRGCSIIIDVNGDDLFQKKAEGFEFYRIWGRLHLLHRVPNGTQITTIFDKKEKIK